MISPESNPPLSEEEVVTLMEQALKIANERRWTEPGLNDADIEDLAGDMREAAGKAWETHDETRGNWASRSVWIMKMAKRHHLRSPIHVPEKPATLFRRLTAMHEGDVAEVIEAAIDEGTDSLTAQTIASNLAGHAQLSFDGRVLGPASNENIPATGRRTDRGLPFVDLAAWVGVDDFDDLDAIDRRVRFETTLTERQAMVWAFRAAEKPNVFIADALGISEATVSRDMKKLEKLWDQFS